MTERKANLSRFLPHTLPLVEKLTFGQHDRMNCLGDTIGTMEKPSVKDRYRISDFKELGFHNCRVWAIKWSQLDFSITLKLDYIVEWVQPTQEFQNYRFWICRANLRFANVDDAKMVLQWDGLPLECCIEALHRRESRQTPNSVLQWFREFELTLPNGCMSLWATGFELRILEEPKLPRPGKATFRLERPPHVALY